MKGEEGPRGLFSPVLAVLGSLSPFLIIIMGMLSVAWYHAKLISWICAGTTPFFYY